MEAVVSPTIDSRVVAKLFKKIIFHYFRVPWVLINDNGTQFIEKKLEALLKKYGVYHKYGLSYHPKLVAKLTSLTLKSKASWKKRLQDQGNIR